MVCSLGTVDDASAVCGLSFYLHVSVVLCFIFLFLYGPSDVYKFTLWQSCRVSQSSRLHIYSFIYLHSCWNRTAQGSPNPTLQFGGHTLKFTSWNVKGRNQPVKRSKVLHHLQSLGTHIAFLQETLLKTNNHSLLHKRWVGQMYHSDFSCKAKGTAILNLCHLIPN